VALRLVVLGTLASNPYAGMAWMHMQIAAGLARLGHDCVYEVDAPVENALAQQLDEFHRLLDRDPTHWTRTSTCTVGHRHTSTS